MKPLPALVAVVSPLALVAGSLLVLAQPSDDTTVPADVAALDARMKPSPEVVVLGNSKVGSDLDLAALAKAIDLDPASVVPMNIDGTNAPVWYAVLQRRVYDHGYKPKVVVVYATLNMMVQVELLSEDLRNQLAKQLGQPDPVVNHKVFGQDEVSPEWQRVLTRRADAHAALLDGLRDGFAGMFFAPPGEGDVFARGNAVAHPALGRVFGTDQMTAAERVRAIPVAEQVRDSEIAASRDVDSTMIPDLVALAKAHGSEIVFVRAPMGTLKRGHDVVPRSLEVSVVQRLHDLGAGYVDLRTAGPPDSGYGDGSHMNRAGRDRFAPRFVSALTHINVGKGPITPASLDAARAAPTTSRAGQAAPLPALTLIRGRQPCDYQASIPDLHAISDTELTEAGYGAVSPILVLENGVALTPHQQDFSGPCAGTSDHYRGVVKLSPTGSDPDAAKSRGYRLAYDPAAPVVSPRGEEAWWVYPGTSLRFAFADDAKGPLTAAVSALPMIAGTGQPTLKVGDQSVPLASAGLALEAGGHSADGAWQVEIASPADGPTLLLQRLAVASSAEADPWYILGVPPSDSLVDVLAGDVAYPLPPRRLYGPNARPTEADWKAGTWVFKVGHLGVPSVEESKARAGTGCSPLRLAVDGNPASSPVDGAPPNTPLATAVHSNDRMLVRFWDARSALDSPDAYSFYLDPDRTCGAHGRWLYPGDRTEITLPPEALLPLREGARTLRLSGAAFSARDGESVHVRVEVGGVAWLDRSVPLSAFESGEVELPLDLPLPRNAGAVKVALTMEGTGQLNGWLLLTYAALAEPGPSVFASAGP